MSPLIVRVVCGVLAVVLLAVIVIRRRNREQQGHEN
jgi:hypothetical protein